MARQTFMHRGQAFIVIAVFAGLLAGPLALRGLIEPPDEIENRAVTPPPNWSLARILSNETGSDLNAFLEDQLTVREAAVELDARIDLNLFGDSPSEDVWLGLDNWLFFDRAFADACTVEGRTDEALAQAAELVSVLSGMGVRTVFTIAPTKSVVYPEFLTPQARRAASCALRMSGAVRSDRIWQEPGFLDIWTDMERVKSDTLLYLPNDTHWNDSGAFMMIRAVAEELDPDLWATSKPVPIDERSHGGDLARLLGVDWPVQTVSLSLERDAQMSGPDDVVDKTVVRTFTSSGEAPLHPGVTVVIHDSFMNTITREMASLFESVSFIHWDLLTPDTLLLVAEADTVVIEVAERRFHGRIRSLVADSELFSVLSR